MQRWSYNFALGLVMSAVANHQRSVTATLPSGGRVTFNISRSTYNAIRKGIKSNGDLGKGTGTGDIDVGSGASGELNGAGLSLDAQKGLTQDQINNMSPAGLVEYWATGDGGDIYFGPDSKMSQLFSSGDGAKLLEDLYYAKFNGSPPHLGKMDRVDYKYTWFFRAFNTNSAVQVMGTWKGHAVRAYDQVLFRAENTMSFNSLTFGRQRAETGWDWLNPQAFGPKANDLNITIEWSRPVR